MAVRETIKWSKEKRPKRQTSILNKLHMKLKIEQDEPHEKKLGDTFVDNHHHVAIYI
jgi:hypothetical protein